MSKKILQKYTNQKKKKKNHFIKLEHAPIYRMTFSEVSKRILRLTDNHESELKPPLHGLPVHLVGEVGEADITLQIPLLEENTALLHIPLIKEQNGSSITVIPLKTGLKKTSEERY